jgi:DNA polymerase III subunit delta
MSIDILKEELKNKKVRNLYLFYGPEEYLKQYYINTIEDMILKADFKSLNKIIFEGKSDSKKIIDISETVPMFSDKKLIIIKNSNLLKPKKKAQDDDGKGKPINDEFLSFLQNIPEYACVLFYETEIDKRMKAIDIIKKNGLIIEFPFQKPAELIKWVLKAFKSHKKEIDVLTASRLIETSEQGMNEILNEINKVVMFTGSRAKIQNDDIDNVCIKSIKSRIFDLTDAIAEKNITAALKLLNDMVILKEPIPKILFMITRQLRHVLEMKLLNAKGLSGNEAATRIKVSPYAASKLQKQTKYFNIEVLKNAIEESLDLDLAIKTGKLNDRIALELLISKLAEK